MTTIRTPRRKLKLPTAFEFATSRDGRFLAVLGRNVVVVDTRDFRRLSSSHPLSHPSSACFSGSGDRLAVKSTSGRIVVIDPVSSEVFVDFANQREGEGSKVWFSPCDNYLVDGSWEGHIRLRDSIRPNAPQSFVFDGEMISGVSPSSDRGAWLFLHQTKFQPNRPGKDPYLSLWGWPLTSPRIYIRPALVRLYSMSLSPDGQCVALVGYSDECARTVLRVLGLDGAIQFEAPIELGGTGASLAWSPDGELLGSVQAGRIVIYQTSPMTEKTVVELEYPSDVAFSPDSSFVAFGSWSGGSLERTPAFLALP